VQRETAGESSRNNDTNQSAIFSEFSKLPRKCFLVSGGALVGRCGTRGGGGGGGGGGGAAAAAAAAREG
jgi:hypothetical protein